MEILELKPIIEAMIFVADEPITDITLTVALAESNVDRDAVKECIAQIEKEWNDDPSRGVGLAHVAGGYQFRTKASMADWLKKMSVPKPLKLSAPSLETLAIVAYRQPIVRGEIEKIRGVDSGGVLKTLLDRRLLRIVGRRDEPGQPLLYGTSKEFLEVFHLNALNELPSLKDIEELMREKRVSTEKGDTAQTQIFDSNSDSDSETGENENSVVNEATAEILKKVRALEGDETIATGDGRDIQIIVPHKLEDDEAEESADMEALNELEKSLKGLRHLEKAMFPKPLDEAIQAEGEGEHASETASGDQETAEGFSTQDLSESQIPEGDDIASSFGEDAPAEDDSALQ